MKILLLLITFQIILNQNYVYTPEFLLNLFNTYSIQEKDIQLFKDKLSKTFDDAYAFNEISKNPPNPSFFPNYYKKVNIQNNLRAINARDTNGYKFYQDLKKALFSLEDLHISLDLSKFYNFLVDSLLHQPLILYIKIYNNEPRIFGIENKDFYWQNFKDYKNVYDIINKNLQIPISTINGKNPFDFITDFGKDYLNLKSRQATFFYKFVNFKNVNLYDFPLSIDDLTNFTVVYDNGQNFATDFVITSRSNYYNNLNTNLFLNDINKQNIFMKNEANNFISINNNELKNLAFINNNYKQLNIESEIINWDYNYNNLYKCRVDHENKININYINSFGGDNIKGDFYKTIVNCVQLFDNNNYPIVLINCLNGGGQIFLAQVLLELLSPKVEFHIYSAFRKTETFINSSESDSYFSLFYNSENCEALNYDYLTKKEHEINYGNNMSTKLTEPFFFLGKKEKQDINNIKKNLKNPRNPTDFIVFTDGFSYSATALFLKYLQYYGGGITVGYFSHPNISKSFFDSGLSP